MVEPQLPPPPGQVVAEPAGMPPALELLGITKRFGQHLALDEVSLSLASGEVLALLGENGAGKTTLMRIASGLEHREGGEIRVRGSRCALASPAEALGLGIAMVHQHFSLVGNLSVAENVVLGRRGRHLHRLSRRRVAAEVEAVAAEYSIEVDGRRRVDQLSIDAQAKVELVKSLYHGARILILDEPTSSLGPRQIEDLFLTVQQMAARGLAIVLVTHRLGEIKQVSDHVVVLRYGRVAEAGPTAAFTEAELARAMIGREFEPSRRSGVAEAVTGAASSVALGSSLGAAGHETTAGDHGPDAVPVIPAALPATGGGEVRLAVRGLEVGVGAARLLAGVSFEAVAGRVLGIIGVEGNGQTELLEVLAGLRRPSAGSVVLDGADVTGADPAELHGREMVSISGDRHRWDIVPGLSVAENIALHAIASGRYRRRGIISWKQVQADALRLAKQFDVRPAGVDLRIEQLSGGNQQKAVIARAVAEHPRVLVLGQPTRGLDIGARQFVHDQVIAARAAQTAIVLLSFDLDELFELSDDVIVLFRGAISYSSPRATASAAAVGAAMTGVEPDPATALAERAGAGCPGGGSRP